MGRDWFKKNEKTVIFGVALVLVSALSFELGILQDQRGKDSVLVIEKPIQSIAQARENTIALGQGTVAGVEAENVERGAQNAEQKTGMGTQSISQCVFVGSKNSTKYHSPSCSYAKKIKPENTVCFKSKEEAEGRGYVAGCIK